MTPSRAQKDVATGTPASNPNAKPAANTPTVTWEFDWVYNCPGNAVGDGDRMCAGAVQACAGNDPQAGLGPQARIFARPVTNGTPGAWQDRGLSCNPTGAMAQAAAQGATVAAPRPVLTMAMVLDAFHRMPFAKPELVFQPTGNTTLITLPGFYAVQWPQAGFEPGEIDQIDPATMLGFDVRIRPKVVTYRYVFGDGTTIETDSAGGPYPDGDVKHAYTRAGRYASHIEVTYSADFSVAGGEWNEVPGTADIVGPAEDITVKLSRNELIAGTGA
ncbi:hypothetical protein MM440_05145 [Arsenicicoccus piscis]|uniref:hypothetical protein n=1 Tax=Arsenicicoccus piscis TaxID=673954 RepID=UPI001F4CAC7C|nr:hypothetical protein [Arsenicicoccus piscis]MCH8627186.1 hypothetical protein [Arsenicicoccus piscis]